MSLRTKLVNRLALYYYNELVECYLGGKSSPVRRRHRLGYDQTKTNDYGTRDSRKITTCAKLKKRAMVRPFRMVNYIHDF